MSKRIVFDQYGPPSVLRIAEGSEAPATPGHLRIRVKAAGIQPFDCLFRSGATRETYPAKFPQGLGNEFAGVVDSVGENVSAFGVGDEVLGWTAQQSHAELVWVAPDALVRKPPTMGWAEAGVLSASGQAAATAVYAIGLGPADVVVVHAAAGGVGSMAVQLARAAGARVIGTAHPRNHDYVRSLGGTPVAYGDGLAERLLRISPAGVTAAIVATSSDESILVSLKLVADRQRIAVLPASPLAERLGLKRLGTQRSVARLAALAALHETGRLTIHVQEQIALREASRAHEIVEAGHVRGKIAMIP